MVIGILVNDSSYIFDFLNFLLLNLPLAIAFEFLLLIFEFNGC